MSRSLAVVALFFLIAFAAWQVEDTRVPDVSPIKSSKLQRLRAPAHQHTSKLTSPIETQIVLEGPKPAADGDTFTLKGTVLSSVAATEVTVKWILPDNVELLSGASEVFVGVLTPYEPQSFAILLQAKDNNNIQVHFQAQAKGGGADFGSVAQFNSEPPAKDFLSKEEALKQGLEAPESLQPKPKLFH